MPNTIGQHAVATFTSPVNGTTPIDANSVRGNDNTLRSSYNNHDADPGVHLQSSALASRPAAGTAGRKWLSNDTGSYRLWYDDGTNWQELTYLSGGGGTISGSLLITGTLGVTGLITATGGVLGNVTGNLTGNASTATALATARTINGVSFDGTANITVTAAAGTLSGSTLASGVTASSLTSVGTLTSLAVSGNATFDTNTLFVDAANNRVGVGTASPNYALSVAGAAEVQNANALHLRNAGNTNFASLFNDGGAFVVETAFAQRFRIDASGNVGIGTASPSAYGKFVVENAGIGGHFNSTSGAAGINFYEAGTGRFSLRSLNGSNGLSFFDSNASVERARIDASGNLGLGVTPSASWSAGFKALQISTQGMSLSTSTSSNDTYLNNNGIYNGTNWLYGNSAAAAQYRQIDGTHAWFTAASGTAGNAISFVQDMTLTGGNLGIGTASPGTWRINAVTSAQTSGRFGGAGGTFPSPNVLVTDSTHGVEICLGGIAAGGAFGTFTNHPQLFYTNNTERARITAAGSFVAGASVALATTATDGFLYVPTCAGAPTGTPTAITGMAPIIVDTTNNKLYFRSGGVWRDAGP
jgi:hypothetical protein